MVFFSILTMSMASAGTRSSPQEIQCCKINYLNKMNNSEDAMMQKDYTPSLEMLIGIL